MPTSLERWRERRSGGRERRQAASGDGLAELVFESGGARNAQLDACNRNGYLSRCKCLFRGSQSGGEGVECVYAANTVHVLEVHLNQSLIGSFYRKAEG